MINEEGNKEINLTSLPISPPCFSYKKKQEDIGHTDNVLQKYYPFLSLINFLLNPSLILILPGDG